MKSFKCKDVGVDCDWQCRGDSEQEVLKQVEEHGRKQHGIQNFDNEFRDRIRSKIRDEKVA